MKILHIGNIANNAYWNARLLNEAGHDNTVLCADYYHMMGCPEWEELYLDQLPADQFYPAWHKVVGEGYSRPAWFLQGKEATCLNFLSADMRSERLAEMLAIESRTIPPRYWSFSLDMVFKSVEIQLSTIIQKILDSLYLHHPKAFSFLRTVKRAFLRTRRDSDCVDVDNSFELRVAELCERYRAEFPNSTPLMPDDFTQYQVNFSLWTQILKKYDFVIGYALDGIRPMLAGVPYAAFEHGTIRDFPYEESARGRLCKLTYRMASHCFVTNLDCVDSAEYLAPGKFSIINHPFDEAVAGCFPEQSTLRQRLLRSLDASFLIFHPTRQDWEVGTGPADKANDNFWRAVGLLRNDGVKVGVVCTKWGRNISESITLIKELGIRPHVEWIDPQATLPFLAMCVAADLVADQFHLGAFGGILPKALACGTPVLTYLDKEKAEKIFPEIPPVLNCKSVEEIASQVRLAFEDEGLIETLAVEGKRWVSTYHSKDLIEEEFGKVLSAISSGAVDPKSSMAK